LSYTGLLILSQIYPEIGIKIYKTKYKKVNT